MREFDVRVDGRTLHGYDAGGGPRAVFWLHGTPNIGPPPEPLAAAAARLGVRLLGYDRPGYGGSAPRPGRDVASAAGDVAAVADALGARRFAVIGHSGGGPHALACAALLPERVTAAAVLAGLAPYDGEDWFAGMAPGAARELRAAVAGRQARAAADEVPGDPDIGFTDRDEEALRGRWAWVLDVVGPALENGPAPAAVDDDVAFTQPWGFDPGTIRVPVLVVHGDADRTVPPAHGRRLAGLVPGAEHRERPGDGHITVLDSARDALEWAVRNG